MAVWVSEVKEADNAAEARTDLTCKGNGF